MSKDRPRLGIKESILFRRSRDAVSTLVGVPDIREPSLTSIELHPRVFALARQAVLDTETNQIERWSRIGIAKNGDFTEVSGLGKEPEFRSDGIEGVSFKISLGDTAKSLYFGRPVPLLFHTHPQYPVSFLRENGVRLKYEGTSIPLEPLAHFNTINASVFSYPDLSAIEMHKRYFRSALLGTLTGYTFIADTNYDSRLVSFRLPHAKEYERTKDILDTALIRKIPTSFESIDWDAEIKIRRDALKAYCDGMGYVAFVNDDINSPQLKRL